MTFQVATSSTSTKEKKIPQKSVLPIFKYYKWIQLFQWYKRIFSGIKKTLLILYYDNFQLLTCASYCLKSLWDPVIIVISSLHYGIKWSLSHWTILVRSSEYCGIQWSCWIQWSLWDPLIIVRSSAHIWIQYSFWDPVMIMRSNGHSEIQWS